MEDQEKELAVVVGYIMFYDLLEDLINGSYFSKIDKAIEIAKDFIKLYPHNYDYEWAEEDFEDTLNEFVKNTVKK
jgi:hypothetical protein